MSVNAAQAKTSAKKVQMPCYFPFQVGDFQITVLYDGNLTVHKDILYNISRDEMDALLAKNFITGDIPSSVNSYLINTGSKLILVDVGAGNVLKPIVGPLLGFLPDNLRKIGYEPEQIDAILLTHFHRDHFGGLLDDQDRPVFPNATVYVPKPEFEYWSSKEHEAHTEERFIPYFKLTQKTAPIFQARGKWKTFGDNEAPIPGVPEIRTRANYGHSPGMTSFEITSGDKKFLIWGDITHVAPLQLPRPEVTITYDLKQDEAIASRIAMLNYAAKTKILVGGIHLPFPGLGHVRAEGKDTFSWVPIYFAYKPSTDTNEY